MSEQFVRVYKKLDVAHIKANLLIYGDLGGSCAACQKIDIKLEAKHCPECGAEFKYIAFRNVRSHLPKLQKLSADRPQMVVIDYEDYYHHTGALKAREFLK